MEKISKPNYLAITALLCLVLIFNFIQWGNPLIAIVGGVIYLFFYGFVSGSIFIAKKGWQFIFGPLFLFSLIAIFSATAIYFKILTDYFFIFLVLLLPIILYAPYYKIKPPKKLTLRNTLLEHFENILDRKEKKIDIVLVFTYLTLAASAFSFLFLGQTTQSIQSPWQTVPKVFFPFYFLATIILLIYILRAKRTKLPLALIVLHTFLSTSVAAIVYLLGYGFDPFIHQTTQKIINQTGQINPTPLYYLGQYGLVVFLHKLTFLDLSLVDRLLVPLLTALLLPLTTFFTFSYWVKKRYALTLALALLIVPFSSFIMTAPQNLANLFFIVTILLSLLYFRGQLSIFSLYLLTFATLAIHPLAGIPLLISVFLLNLFKLMYESYRRYISLFFLIAIIFIFALPIAFILNGSAVNLILPELNLSELFPLKIVNEFDAFLDLGYLIYFNKIWLASLVILIGLYYLAKNKLLINNAPYLIIAFVIFVNYLFVKYLLVFPGLRNLDQVDFINRISWLAFYVLLPLFLIGLHRIIKKLYEHDIFTKIFVIVSLSGLILTGFYFSYPRLNQYEPAKFFNVSQSDIRAVELIAQDAGLNEYIVLANQMVGAAAIQEFGFKKYYNNQFYYSMPMGSPRTLYDLFLEMTYQGAKKETMVKAMAEAGVDEAYFVLNNYWRDFENIRDQATRSADGVFVVDEGKIYIFKYHN